MSWSEVLTAPNGATFTAGQFLTWTNHYVGQTADHIDQIAADTAATRAMTTTLIGRDPSVPIDEAQLHAALNANIDEEVAKIRTRFDTQFDELRTAHDSARNEDRAALIAAVREVMPEQADAILDRLGDRLSLRPA